MFPGGVQSWGQLCGDLSGSPVPPRPSLGHCPLFRSPGLLPAALPGAGPQPLGESAQDFKGLRRLPIYLQGLELRGSLFPCPRPFLPPCIQQSTGSLRGRQPRGPQQHRPDHLLASLGSCEPGLPGTTSGCLWARIHGSDRQRSEALLIPAMAAAALVSRSFYRDHLLKNQRSGDSLSPETADRQRPSQDRRPRPVWGPRPALQTDVMRTGPHSRKHSPAWG